MGNAASPWMVPAIMSVFGGIQGYGAGSDMQAQAGEMKKLAERNALLSRRELQEQVRRQSEEDYRVRSAALARAAASGARVSGSVADYLEYMGTEQSRQLEWLKTSGASRIRLQLAADMNNASAMKVRGKTQQWSSMVGAFTSAFSYMDKGGLFAEEVPTGGKPPPSGNGAFSVPLNWGKGIPKGSGVTAYKVQR